MVDKIIKSFTKRSRNTKSEASNDSPLSGLFILPIPHLTIIFCKWVGSTTGKLHPPFFVGGLDISLGDLSKTLVALTERVEQMEGKGHQTMEAGDRTWVE